MPVNRLCILFVSEIAQTKKQVGQNLLSFQEAIIEDQTGIAKLALWGDMINSVTEGDFIKIPQARVKLFGKEDKKLTTTSFSADVCNFFQVIFPLFMQSVDIIDITSGA